jgi:hypothetical protein
LRTICRRPDTIPSDSKASRTSRRFEDHDFHQRSEPKCPRRSQSPRWTRRPLRGNPQPPSGPPSRCAAAHVRARSTRALSGYAAGVRAIPQCTSRYVAERGSAPKAARVTLRTTDFRLRCARIIGLSCFGSGRSWVDRKLPAKHKRSRLDPKQPVSRVW